jgi:hypothetical protein
MERTFDSDPRLQFRFWSLTTGVGVVAFLSWQECLRSADLFIRRRVFLDKA